MLKAFLQNVGFVIIGLLVFFVLTFGITFWVMKRTLIREGKERFGEDEYLFTGTFPIVEGLPLPEGAKCSVHCLKSRIVIEANGQEFSLPVERLVDVDEMSKTQIQKQYVSDAGGAVAGAMVFGAIGAASWGKPELKTIRNTSSFLVFTYMDADGEQTKYIVFDSTKKSTSNFTEHFEYLKQREKTRIDL